MVYYAYAACLIGDECNETHYAFKFYCDDAFHDETARALYQARDQDIYCNVGIITSANTKMPPSQDVEMKGVGNHSDEYIVDASMLEQELNEKCARNFPATRISN